MLLTPGTRLGPYTIETLLGSGGMGEVYKAHDERLNRPVAIKRSLYEQGGRNPKGFVSETVMHGVPSKRRFPMTTGSRRRMLCSHASELLDVVCPQTSDCRDASDPGLSATGICPRVSATLGVTRTMKSMILGEDRKVFVRLPTSYDTSGNAYPVLYLLDGTPAFLLEMIAITTRLRNDRNAPEMIIVAIENTNRNRDMMPVVAKDYPGPPRAEAFLGFLEKELIPDIEKTYRTSQPRILLGKSLSGLFTVYSLLARPTAFNAYVGCSAGWFAENND